MRRLILFSLAVSMPASSVVAQEDGKIPPPRSLVAHYADARGTLSIGGGPEAGDIAAILGNTASARIVGDLGAVPLLAQGMIAVAILPREMSVNERAATRRFSGGRPVAVPIMQGLLAYARTDGAGAADVRVTTMLSALLSDAIQDRLASRLPQYRRLAPDALAAARAIASGVGRSEIPDAQAGSRSHDGKLAIIGSDTLVSVLPDLISGYARQHPSAGFTTDLRGSSLAIPALAAGTSAIAPMGREAWQDDLDAFRQVKGYAPTRIRIAYASHGPSPDGKTPPAIYVNASNPLAKLSIAQIRRVFAAGAPGGDVSTWSELGVSSAPWKQASIHVYGGRKDGGFAVAMQQSKLNGLPFSARYRSMPSGLAVLKAVAADPLGIGYATWMDAGEAPNGVRLVPLGKSDAGPFVLPSDIARRGAWPISYFFNIYVDRAPGQRLSQAIKQFVVFLLSDEGQRIIGAHIKEEDGYVPLNRADLIAERKIADRL